MNIPLELTDRGLLSDSAGKLRIRLGDRLQPVKRSDRRPLPVYSKASQRLQLLRD